MPQAVRPFHKQNEYTMMHNIVIDYIMPKLSGSAWKVLTVIIRKTIGWHKECDELSFSQIKQLTGIKSDTTVSEALKDLEKLGVVKIDRPDREGDDPARFWKSNIYALNLDFEVEIDSGEKVPLSQELTPPTPKNGVPPSPENGPGVLQKMETQNKESLSIESKKDSSNKRGGSKSPPPTVAVSVKAYQEITNRYPDKATWGMIIQSVGESPEKLDFWKKVIVTWIACSFNPRNIAGMLDCFNRGELPTTKKQGANNGRNQQPKNETSKLNPANPDDWKRMLKST